MTTRQARVIVWFLAAAILGVGCGRADATLTATAAPTATATPTSQPPTSTPVPTATTMPTPDFPEPERPLLMAHYMSWYQTLAVSGYWGWHWTMEHFNPNLNDKTGRPNIASYYMPLTGPYDSSDDALLEYQVLLMHLSGIDGVIVDWYGIEDFWDYATINASTHKLFTHVQNAGLRFAICYEDQTIKHMVDNKHLPVQDVYTHGQDVMRYLEETWFQSDTYLKVLDRPVLLTFGPQYYKGGADWEKLFSVLSVRPALITLDEHAVSADVSSFPWPPMWAGKQGVLSQERLDQYLTAFDQKAERWDYVVAGAFPGFQDIYEEAGIADEARYLDPRDGETFRFTLQRAVDLQPDVIQLITWNDYGESTIIEPTEEFGYRYLEMVQEVRRDTDPAGFSFAAEDLRLPIRLFELRKKHTGNTEINAQLDQISDAILTGDLGQARALLAEYTE